MDLLDGPIVHLLLNLRAHVSRGVLAQARDHELNSLWTGFLFASLEVMSTVQQRDLAIEL